MNRRNKNMELLVKVQLNDPEQSFYGNYITRNKENFILHQLDITGLKTKELIIPMKKIKRVSIEVFTGEVK
jgi:hypothetical protein